LKRWSAVSPRAFTATQVIARMTAQTLTFVDVSIPPLCRNARLVYNPFSE
jgi:hypothetical protein